MSDELIEGRSLRGRRPPTPPEPEPPLAKSFPPDFIPRFLATTGELQPITEESIAEIEETLEAHIRGETPGGYVPQFEMPTGEFRPLTWETFDQLVALAVERSWRRVPPARRVQVSEPPPAPPPAAAPPSEEFIPWFDTATGELPPILVPDEEVGAAEPVIEAEEAGEEAELPPVRVMPVQAAPAAPAPPPRVPPSPPTGEREKPGPITRQLLAAIRGEVALEAEGMEPPPRWKVWQVVLLLVIVAALALAVFVPGGLGSLLARPVADSEPSPTPGELPAATASSTETSTAPVTGVPVATVTPTAVEPVEPLLPYQQGLMAFASNRDGDFEIYVLDMVTGVITQLTDNRAEDRWPAWSPDGRRIMFVSDRAGDDDLFVMDADGANLTQLTTATAMDRHPAWSPDGTTVIFSRETVGGSDLLAFDAACMARAGACEDALRVITTGRYDLYPVWSPDGRRIAFAASDFPGLPSVIALLNPDGSRYVALEGTGSSDSQPAWSPDGSRLAFVSFARGDNDLYVMDTGGSRVIQLTVATSSDVEPVWSPDGGFLAFASDRGTEGDFELYVMRADCAAPDEGCEDEAIQITDNSADDLNPAWLP